MKSCAPLLLFNPLLSNLAVCAGLGVLPLIAMEAGKWIKRRRKQEVRDF